MATRALRKSAICLPLAVLLAVAGWLFFCPVAHGQNINQLRGILGAAAPSGADLATLEKFKTDYFAKFNDPNNDLPTMRKEYNRMVRGIDDTPGHRKINDGVMTEVMGILRGNAPKVVKYNAMLMVADLNANDGRNVKPLPKAYSLLKMAFDLPPSWDYIRPAVLIGLKRFAEDGGIPPADTAKVTGMLLKLLNEKNAPAGRSASAHDYLRRGAARALAAMGSPGPDNSVLNAFVAIAADPKARPTMRCEMARFIGELNYPPGTKSDWKQLANILGHQAVEVCQQQLSRQSSPEDGSGTRRATMYALDSCSEGLQKLSGVTSDDPETRNFIVSLKREMDNLHRELDDVDKTNDAAVAAVVQTQIDVLETLLLEKPQP